MLWSIIKNISYYCCLHSADEDEDYDSADESGSDFEDIPYPSSYLERDTDLDLPETVTTLTSPDGCKVYLVGTAHFSHTSQDDVAKVTATFGTRSGIFYLRKTSKGIWLHWLR